MTPEQKARVSIDALLVAVGPRAYGVAEVEFHVLTCSTFPDYQLLQGSICGVTHA